MKYFKNTNLTLEFANAEQLLLQGRFEDAGIKYNFIIHQLDEQEKKVSNWSWIFGASAGLLTASLLGGGTIILIAGSIGIGKVFNLIATRMHKAVSSESLKEYAVVGKRAARDAARDVKDGVNPGEAAIRAVQMVTGCAREEIEPLIPEETYIPAKRSRLSIVTNKV